MVGNENSLHSFLPFLALFVSLQKDSSSLSISNQERFDKRYLTLLICFLYMIFDNER